MEHGARIEAAVATLATRVAGRLIAEEAVTTLERDYEVWKLEQTVALIGTDNPQTNKPHSVSSAKEGIKDLPAYSGWTVKLDRVRAEALQARLEHELALETLRSVRVVALVETGVANV